MDVIRGITLGAITVFTLGIVIGITMGVMKNIMLGVMRRHWSLRSIFEPEEAMSLTRAVPVQLQEVLRQRRGVRDIAEYALSARFEGRLEMRWGFFRVQSC